MSIAEPTVQKSPQAFRTISEVAQDLDVPQHVLRFWESKFAHIKPLKRGGGRRYYRPEDVDLLRGVRALLYKDGYTIKGVQKVFRDQGVRFVVETGRSAQDESVAGIAREAVNRSAEQPQPVPSEIEPLEQSVRAGLLQVKARLERLQDRLTASESEEEPEVETA